MTKETGMGTTGSANGRKWLPETKSNVNDARLAFLESHDQLSTAEESPNVDKRNFYELDLSREFATRKGRILGKKIKRFT